MLTHNAWSRTSACRGKHENIHHAFLCFKCTLPVKKVSLCGSYLSLPMTSELPKLCFYPVKLDEVILPNKTEV